MFVSLFLVSTSYSQTLILNKGGDSLIAFTIPQAKFILKLPAKIKEQSAMLDVCEKQKLYKDSTSRADSIIIKSQAKTIENKDEAILIKDMLCKAEKQGLNSEINRQCRQKWLAIVITSVIFSAEIYFRIKN